MNQNLKAIQELIQQNKQLTEQDKEALLKAIADADKQWSITDFKLDRTEKVKKTTAILLEETIGELEQKRKAVEAQNRELEIEAALERVRSRAMSMQTSEEINALTGTLFNELTKLNFVVTRCLIIIIIDPNTKSSHWFMANPEDPLNPMNFFVKYHEHPGYLAALKGWEERALKWVYLNEGILKKNWDEFLLSETEMFLLPEAVKAGMRANERAYVHAAFCNFGALSVGAIEPLEDEQFDILLRFAKVFDLTYTRFNDLQKAEAQAREAQIEAALERIRAIAMSMMKSDELMAICEAVFKQLQMLGFTDVRAAQIYIRNDAEEKFLNYDYSDVTGADVVEVSYNSHPNTRKIYDVIKNAGDALVDNVITKQELDEWKSYLYNTLKQPPEKSLDSATELHYYLYSFGMGAFGICTFKSINDDELQILKRFRNVFSLSYQRYADIAQAEAQAREAKIEAALERVRAKTMAMHTSEQLAETAKVFFEQFNLLGKIPDRMSIGIINEETKKVELWVTDQSGNQLNQEYFFSIQERTSIAKLYAAWKEDKDTIIIDLTGQDLQDWLQFVKEEAKLPIDETRIKGRRVQQAAFFSQGFLLFTTHEPVADEIMKLLVRFARVFEQTYTRFLDLQKAEAQAREATIEAALEKVRGKAMAMHNSNDLSSTASLVFTELRKLGINPIRCGVGLFNKESRKSQLYSATSSPDGDSLSLVGWVMMTEHPVLEKIYESWLNNEEYYPELQGEQLRSYYQLFLKGLPVAMPDMDAGKKQYGHFLPFSIGCLNTWSDHPHNEPEIKILRRFATIIDLTFRRYLELQKSEANAKDAVKQAALDRIRADIASMRTINDLDRITPLIWNELNILGVPFTRCGVFIMDDLQQLIHTFLSTPDGKAIAAFHLPYDTPGNFSDMLYHWRQKENYISHWNKDEFESLADSLVQQGAVATKAEYLNTLPEEGIYLHFLSFLQGMLYVGNTAPLKEDDIKLIQSLADAFATAYARYEDFNKLEAAKQQVDKTLVDLKQAQTQLVQSEKMASLGELTAGIAHEIQNPLNFVNNFSEVNDELIGEMVEELDKGNTAEVKTIANDIKQNLEKINYHGKRADSIVKGMLLHSRVSSGQKEPTDINALADEYLRLSYHGLRAKDKSFNSGIKTDFDDTIGKINIVPQDIGRVLLNLFNNAFYAVNEKKKSYELSAMSYEPLVSVQTKKLNDKIEVTVKDNGNGIPQNIVDKIFQPFFTTKPTGQGTGLGLSLSYDIVKAHGGEIKVKTKEGEGTTFIIQLSVV